MTFASAALRRLYVLDLGHEKPTIVTNNHRRSTTAEQLTRSAQKVLMENTLSDAVRFLHMTLS